MNIKAFLAILFVVGAAFGASDRNLTPAVQGPYLMWRGTATLNPMDANSYSAVGWRERLYEDTHPAFTYNYIGVEFFGDIDPHELSVGSRLLLQPTSFASASLTYRLSNFPKGVIRFKGGERWTYEKAMDRWDDRDFTFNTFADEFSMKTSLHKDWGAVQGEIPFEWGRYDIRDETRDSIYIPSLDLIGSSRDDFYRLSPVICYRFKRPFLFSAGLAHTVTWTDLHDVRSQRTGIVYQMWPFSERKEGELLRYWSFSTRFDLWTESKYKHYQPRVECSLSWERNLFDN